MGRQSYNARVWPIRISEEVAIRINSISRAVKAVCFLNSLKNLRLVILNYTLNCRAGNNVKSRSGCHVLFS